MPHSGAAGDPSVLLEAARDAFAANAWREAYDTFTETDSSTPLGASDLELMATAASMLGRDEEWLGILERAHYGNCDAGATLRAVRCAFWIGVWLARRGEMGRATGWFARAHRLLQHEEGENVERGYLLLPEVFRHELRETSRQPQRPLTRPPRWATGSASPTSSRSPPTSTERS